MEAPDGGGVRKRATAASTRGEPHADALVHVELAAGASDGPPAGPASPDRTSTDAGPVVVDDRRNFLASLFMLPSRSRMARRLLAAGDAERARIEQDIHDGVQQHLTALRIQLSLAADRFRAGGDSEAAAVLDGFGDDIDGVIDEMRDLAQGIYPALLTSYGLGTALVQAGRRAPVPVSVEAAGVRRCRPEVEIAVYFSCLAALDNAAKHAGPGPVRVCLSDTGPTVHFTVCDAGVGFDASRTPTGSGIANMRNRIAAIGGTLTIDSAPAQGTHVEGRVPDPWRQE